MTNQKNTNFIANVFNWLRDVIESAETPFSLLAVVVLPVIAPVVPAVITGIRLHSEMNLDSRLATVTAVVLELLGYAGAITFIRSFSKWLREETSFVKMIMYAGVYLFYVAVMYLINVKLGSMAGDSETINQIFALLSFITIPTGLLAAEHINERSEKEEIEKREVRDREEKEKLRMERRQDKMEKWRMAHGANGSGELTEQKHRTPNEHRTNSSVSGSVANKANEIRSFVRQVQETEQRTPRVSEIASVLGVAKSYASETLKIILNEQGEN